jgi:uncharacterized membrane protein YgdD (TMEM256/DUF423 family)
MTNSFPWISIASFLGGIAVIFGAFAAHGLEGKVEPKAIEWVKTGAFYQLTHALALMGWALWCEFRVRSGLSPSALPGGCFAIGTVIFSGTLYAMALGAPRWLGAVTPLGGTLLILGWAVFAVSSLK